MHFLYSFPTCKAESHHPRAACRPCFCTSLAADPGGGVSKGRSTRGNRGNAPAALPQGRPAPGVPPAGACATASSSLWNRAALRRRSRVLDAINKGIVTLSTLGSRVSSVVPHRFLPFLSPVLLLRFPSRLPSRHSQKTLFTGIS